MIVLHDLNMALRYSDHVVLFSGGRIVAGGPTRDILTDRRVQEVFGVRCRIIALPDEDGSVLVTLPVGAG